MEAEFQPANQETVDTFNSFLRGELSAVETYRQAITKMDGNPIPELDEIRQCHQRRIEDLRSVIVSLGGKPDETSGLWGALTELIEGGAALLGRSTALAALEQGEDLGLSQYQEDVTKLSGPARVFIETRIIPHQRGTHDRMSRIISAEQ